MEHPVFLFQRCGELQSVQLKKRERYYQGCALISIVEWMVLSDSHRIRRRELWQRRRTIVKEMFRAMEGRLKQSVIANPCAPTVLRDLTLVNP